MLKRLAIVVAVLCCVAAFAPTTSAESELDFTLVNATGYGISELYIAPASQTEWGESLLEENLENGESVDISFHPSAASVQKWDLMVTWVDGGEHVYWRNLKLSEISKITLKYNRSTGATTAATE